ncbi:MAG: sulfite exporter TauE/SafE family protein [Deltaproteobacteria bacterium]|nr:sulfite exporter TauE/SafE family protein [Deltaproteobacteria bacterium]
MGTMVWTVFAASVVGSLHCAGMCGGLVAFAVGAPAPGTQQTGRGWRERWRQGLHCLGGVQSAYHGGRLLAYSLLGMAAGALGRGVDAAGASQGWSQSAAAAAGVAMIAWGTWNLLGAAGVKLPRAHRFAALASLYGATLRRLRAQPAMVRAGVLGLASALLPCGWLYAFVITAAGTGSATGGALAMAAFWAGTLPMLAALGAGVQALAGPMRRHVPKLAAAALVLVGVLAIAHRAQPLPGTAGDPRTCCHGQ